MRIFNPNLVDKKNNHYFLTMKKLIILILLVVLVIGGYSFWRHKARPKISPQMPAVKVITYEVVPTKFIENLTAVGTLDANAATLIRAEVPGKVAKIEYKEGQAMKAGDLILEIEDDNYLQGVERAQAAFELATLTYNRNIELQKSGAVALQAKDESQASLRMTESDFETAKILLRKSKIKAPFDGIVGVSTISVGDYLNVGDPVIYIASIDPLKMQFTVPQKYLSNIKDGAPVVIETDAWPNKKFEGNIYAINPQIDVDTRNITIKALVPNSDGFLRPGMFAYINLGVAENDVALLVPEEALIPSGELMTVIKVVDGKAQTAKVKVGVQQNGMAEITEGLKPGDVVISAGNLKVRDGVSVQSISGEMPQDNSEAKK